jgi:hypothetical protein
MQNKQVDEFGYEVTAEATQTRNDLEPEARKQAANWQSFRTDTASRPWGPAR